MSALIELAIQVDDGYITSEAVTGVVESYLPGFTSQALPKCHKENARAQNEYFPLEDFVSSLILARDLDFGELWNTMSGIPGIDELREERLQIYNETTDPHPRRVFDLDASVWFQNLLRDKISVDRYHCSYLGSHYFAEVSLNSDIAILI